MLLMAEPIFETRKQIKTTAASDAALAEIVARLKRSRTVKWKGGRVTQEAFYNAVWLWLETFEPHQIEKAMETFVPRLEAIMTGEADESTPLLVAEPPESPTGPLPPNVAAVQILEDDSKKTKQPKRRGARNGRD